MEVYPVTKDVGKVGNNSPSFIIPLDSKENKSNIANFFANASKKGVSKYIPTKKEAEIQDEPTSDSKGTVEAKDHESPASLKRKASRSTDVDDVVPAKQAKKADSGKISATKNQAKSPRKILTKGTPKITNFFSK